MLFVIFLILFCRYFIFVLIVETRAPETPIMSAGDELTPRRYRRRCKIIVYFIVFNLIFLYLILFLFFFFFFSFVLLFIIFVFLNILKTAPADPDLEVMNEQPMGAGRMDKVTVSFLEEIWHSRVWILLLLVLFFGYYYFNVYRLTSKCCLRYVMHLCLFFFFLFVCCSLFSLFSQILKYLSLVIQPMNL
jgi:hypothetical protein